MTTCCCTRASATASFPIASRISIWTSGCATAALNASRSGCAARASPRSPSAEAAGMTSSGSLRARRRRARTCVVSLSGPPERLDGARPHPEVGVVHELDPHGKRLGVGEGQRHLGRGLRERGIRVLREQKERVHEAGQAVAGGLDRAVPDPDERAAEMLEDPAREEVRRVGQEQVHGALPHDRVSVREERHDLAACDPASRSRGDA